VRKSKRQLKQPEHKPDVDDQDNRRLLVTLVELVEVFMSTQQDLVNSVSNLKQAVNALEQKVDSTPGTGTIVNQATLDQAVVDIDNATARINVETDKK
jgi:hypothetical protein